MDLKRLDMKFIISVLDPDFENICIKQIKLLFSLYTCASNSELPSNISSMVIPKHLN